MTDLPGERLPESRFTTPTDLCPHPERWTSTDGDSTEVEVSDFAYGLVRALQPSCVIETGAGFGQTTEQIGRALAANGPLGGVGGVVFALEIDADRYRHVKDRCRYLSSVFARNTDSLEWTPETTEVEMLWLDSWYEHRVAEFNRFRPLLRPGSIACFHDTAPEHGAHRIPSGRDLRSEIEHELADVVRVVHLPTPRGLTLAEVK